MECRVRFAINGLLKQSGFTLPSDALLDSQYDGLSAETIFAQRESAKKPGDHSTTDWQHRKL